MVNIFLPFPNIYYSIKCLDDKRLGKQRLECKQIINLLEEYDRTHIIPSKGWSSHPAFLSWIGYTNHLKVYFNICVREWINRGFVNNMELYYIDESLFNIVECSFDESKAVYDNSKFNIYSFPYWITFPPFYKSHQAALLRKNPKYYIKFFGLELGEFINNGYLWPCKITLECINNWNFSYHEPLACGCPPIYRISLRTIVQWVFNPTINPLSGRNISENSNISKEYLELYKQYGLCLIFNNGEYYIKDNLINKEYVKLNEAIYDITTMEILLKLLQ